MIAAECSKCVKEIIFKPYSLKKKMIPSLHGFDGGRIFDDFSPGCENTRNFSGAGLPREFLFVKCVCFFLVFNLGPVTCRKLFDQTFEETNKTLKITKQ